MGVLIRGTKVAGNVKILSLEALNGMLGLLCDIVTSSVVVVKGF